MTGLTMPQTLESVRCLSVRRPWANLIVAGPKRIENRTWTTDYRGLVVIHAGKTWDAAGAAMAARLGMDGFDTAPQCATGYLGLAELLNVHPADDGCCPQWGEHAPGIYHWTLGTPTAFPDPVSGGGRMGLYTCTDPAVLSAITRVTRKSTASQVNPIVKAAAAQVAKSRRRKATVEQLSLFALPEEIR